MPKLRHEADDSPDHFQVYSGQVRVGTIYRAHNTSASMPSRGALFFNGRLCSAPLKIIRGSRKYRSARAPNFLCSRRNPGAAASGGPVTGRCAKTAAHLDSPDA
jgi:hypothetical protein